MAIEHLTSLELFLLALVERGWTTPYALKQTAGISVGAALPALNRLHKRKLLHRAEIAARNKQDFAITAIGKKTLASEKKRLLKKFQELPPSDSESVLRLAALLVFDRKASAAISLLKTASAARRRTSEWKLQESPNLVATDVPTLFRSMVEVCDAARAESDATSFTALAKQLGRNRIP